jgi:hypothetical protein
MKFLIDTRSLQAATHFGKLGEWKNKAVPKNFIQARGERLSGFLRVIEDVSGVTPEPSPGLPNELCSSYLDSYACLVLTTRIFMLSREEIEDIRKFVTAGGSLLVMSNHPPFNKRDNKLATAFGFNFLSPVYPWDMGQMGVTTIQGDDLGQHPITKELEQGIVFNNSCRIAISETAIATILAYLPKESPPENIFALAMERSGGAQESGRIVAVADSGFVGQATTKAPGPGQFEKGDNATFLRNVVSWLCRRL